VGWRSRGVAESAGGVSVFIPAIGVAIGGGCLLLSGALTTGLIRLRGFVRVLRLILLLLRLLIRILRRSAQSTAATALATALLLLTLSASLLETLPGLISAGLLRSVLWLPLTLLLLLRLPLALLILLARLIASRLLRFARG